MSGSTGTKLANLPTGATLQGNELVYLVQNGADVKVTSALLANQLAGALPLSGGTMTGPLYYTATGGNTSRSAQDRAADVINVLDHGADPTGVLDSAPAFSQALALRRNGKAVDVHVPSGNYLLKSPVIVGDLTSPQRLFGNGWSSKIIVDNTFQASANGVIIIQAGVQTESQPSVCDLYIHFQQPIDISTPTTAQTNAGGTTITVADVTGIQVGYYIRCMPHPNSLPFQTTMPKVTNIAGNVITMDQAAVATISSGDAMQFAPNRSMAVSLSSVPSLAPGSPVIKYPWAIYCVAQSVFIDHVLVGGAWNGVYIRGSTFVIGQYFCGCLNIGLDIDQCYNFPKIDHYQLWGWGFGNSRASVLGIYYDGQTIAANIGKCDDFAADIVQSWCGIVNLTSTWSWGQINQLKLDGSNSALNILGAGWLQVSNAYKTGGQDHVGIPILQTGTCKTFINNLVASCAQPYPTIQMSTGSMTIGSGYIWNGVIGSNPMINVTGGDLSIDQMRFDSSAGRVIRYIDQTGGSVRVSNSAFVIAPGVGGVGFQLTDAARNSIRNVDLNGWAITGTGPLGTYETHNSTTGTIYNVAGSHHFFAPDVTTSAQVNVRPTSVAAAEGKLRMYGAFPTGADIAPRLAFSMRSGFATASWTNSYMNFYLANGTNDVSDDANMTRVFRMSLFSYAFGYDTLAVTPVLSINGVGTVGRRVQFQTASVPRWDMLAGDAETGTDNGGMNFRIARYDDAGIQIDAPLGITRSTGVTNITNLAVGTNAGPTILANTGVPAAAQPKGSIRIRTDGGVGSTIYISQGGGVWNPIPGV